MKNFKQDVLEAAKDETIECVIFRETTLTYNPGPDYPEYADLRDIDIKYKNIPLSWEAAAPLLDYKYDAGFGLMDCHDILFWTTTKVFYIYEYDGSTRFQYELRNPPAVES